MTDKPHGQRMLSFLLRSARGALFRGVLVLFLVDPANAAVFTVNTGVDFGRDANPGDGVCETCPETASAVYAQRFKRRTLWQGMIRSSCRRTFTL